VSETLRLEDRPEPIPLKSAEHSAEPLAAMEQPWEDGNPRHCYDRRDRQGKESVKTLDPYSPERGRKER